MAEKADLMVKAAKLGEEVERLTAAVEKATTDLTNLPSMLAQAKQEARAQAQASFSRRQEEIRTRMEAALAQKKTAASDLLDTFPDKDTKEFAGKFEIQELEDHLMEVYPPGMIEDYMCLDPIPLEDDETAFKLYFSVENMVMSLTKGGSFSASIFNGINTVLNTITDDPRVGLKVVPAIVMFYIVGVIFLPFLFLTGFSVVGFASAIQGLFVKRLLRRLYSVKLYLNTAYDEDIFQQNKTDIMRDVDDYIDYVRSQYTEVLDSRKFEHDPAVDKKIDKDFDLQEKKIRQTRDLNNTELQRLKQELASTLERIDHLEDEERRKAEGARKQFLETISWEHAWMEHIFIDVTPENKLLMMPFAKANSCYYSQDEEVLKQFSRLVTFQATIRMHPEFATQVVLDYKYMGGDLTQFLTLKGKCIKLCFSEEDIRKQTEIITNEIKARTKSILASSANLDEFNALMASYDSAGEYYAIIHIFGLDSISTAMKNWFHNGPRVGYIFKFYWTYDEMKALKDDLPLVDIKDFYEILGNPMPRTAAAVRRVVGLDS